MIKNILVITYWSFNDALIQTYTLPYLRIIRQNIGPDKKIYLFTLDTKKKYNDKYKRLKRDLEKENIFLTSAKYSNFGLKMFFKSILILSNLIFLIYFKKISHIHTWCTPAGAMGYFLKKITGRRLILDSFEPHAEPMLESNTWSKKDFKFKLLFKLEELQVKNADRVITCVKSMNEYVKEKYNYDLKNYYSKPACINFENFSIQKKKNKVLLDKLKLNDKIVCVYAGKIGGSYLKQELFDFVKAAEIFWGRDNFRFLFLNNQQESEIKKYLIKSGISESTIIRKFVDHKEIPDYIGLGDFGITPFVPVPSKRYGSPIKTGEYWAMGLPVVITKDISDDSDTINDNDIGYVLQNLTIDEYNKACKKINQLIKKDSLAKEIIEIVQKQNNFSVAEKVYSELYAKESLPKKNILVTTFWSYNDPLVQTYTLPYINIIQEHIRDDSKVILFTVEQSFYEKSNLWFNEEKNKLSKNNIILIDSKHSRNILLLFFRLTLKTIVLLYNIFRYNINTIHAWCTPAGSIAYLLALITNKTFVLDSYEPHAEAMVENGTWSRKSMKFKILFWFEKKQSKKANYIIALTDKMKDYAKEKYDVTLENYYVKPALVNQEEFKWDINNYLSSRKNLGLEDKIIMVYAGKLGGIYLKEEVFDFISVANSYWQDKLKVFLLTSNPKNEIETLLQEKNISTETVTFKYVNHNEIKQYLEIADFAINPVKPVLTKRFCTSIKDGEYWSMGLPIVITKNISDDSDIITFNNAGYVLNDLNKEEYLNACRHLDTIIKSERIEDIRYRISDIAKKYRSFEIAHKVYSSIYKNIS
jgi:glycosyltransferase involved in cell wall biosynthesis